VTASRFMSLQLALRMSWLLASVMQLYSLAISQGMPPAGIYAVYDVMLLGLTTFLSLIGAFWLKSIPVGRGCQSLVGRNWMLEKWTILYPENPAFPDGDESEFIGVLGTRDDEALTISHVYAPYFLCGTLCTGMVGISLTAL
jgi:hypothetical protein